MVRKEHSVSEETACCSSGGWFVAAIFGLTVLPFFWSLSHAQVKNDSLRTWRVFVDGKPYRWSPPVGSAPQEASIKIRERFYEEGFYQAQIDSVVHLSKEIPLRSIMYVSQNERTLVGQLEVNGLPDFLDIAEVFNTAVGKAFDPDVLEADLKRLLLELESRGFLLASIERPAIRILEEEGSDGLYIGIQVDAGASYTLAGVVLDGAKKTTFEFVGRLTGLEIGEVIETGMERVRSALLATHFFRQVGLPEVIPLAGNQALLRIPIHEEPPGAFDLVLGYQPGGTGNSASGLVGNGHLLLRNMFGGGRTLGLRLHRQPGLISQVEARFSDPFFAGLPFRVEGAFEGLQQDSSYNQQHLEGLVGYRINPGMEVLLSVRSEATEPAQAGLRLLNGEQSIPNTSVVYFGAVLRIDTRDQPLNPSSGMFVESRYERGQKASEAQVISDSQDTTLVRRSRLQERLGLQGRGFLGITSRQVLALGIDARVLISDSFDESELFRFGGTTSLRGFEEDRFRGRLVARSLVEYRYRFERLSYGFLFFDLGYFERPETVAGPALNEIQYGYGFGFQFNSGVGLINTSFALGKGDSPSQAKVHIGLSLGL